MPSENSSVTAGVQNSGNLGICQSGHLRIRESWNLEICHQIKKYNSQNQKPVLPKMFARTELVGDKQLLTFLGVISVFSMGRKHAIFVDDLPISLGGPIGSYLFGLGCRCYYLMLLVAAATTYIRSYSASQTVSKSDSMSMNASR